MPELPEVEALAADLSAHVAGRTVSRCELAAIAALKTYDPPLEDLVGRTALGCERRGKHLCLRFEGRWLVFHLARGGWVRWSETLPAARARPTRSPLVLRLGFDDGAGLDMTEMGTEKRFALWVVDDPAEVPSVAQLGIDPLDPAFDVEALRRALAGESANLKTVLTRQSVIAGVGNAYSDEALHAARLSPFKSANKLSDDELVRLHDALVSALRGALVVSMGRPASALKDDKRATLRVHGRTGERCDVCGDTIREVSFATKSLQYCATCQTGGKPLADRRMSRLLK